MAAAAVETNDAAAAAAAARGNPWNGEAAAFRGREGLYADELWARWA